MHMKLFLQEVASGHGFKPEGNAVNDLAAFQPLVETALQAEALGYVESVVTHKESYTGQRSIVLSSCVALPTQGVRQPPTSNNSFKADGCAAA